MFATLHTVHRALVRIACRLDPGRLTVTEAARLIDVLSAIERLVVGARVRLASRVDDSVAGAEGERGPARWMAKHTGQTVTMAQRDIDASERLGTLAATDRALRDGELTAVQAHEVTSAAELDPAAEASLLETARQASVSELRARAKRVRAAATDDDQKHRKAHEDRDVSSRTDEETGEGHLGVKGPASTVGQMLAFLEPWVQAQFEKARREGRKERRGAYVFDALLAALAFAADRRRNPGHGDVDPDDVPTGPPVSILARVDVPAMVRGHTLAGEVCEIDGFGPVPVAALRELLPQAAIDLILTDGVDAWNITHLGRRAVARQKVVLDWAGVRCSRLGCPATRHLQIDHRDDWAKVEVTELQNLDPLCGPDHARKTHHGWALVAGTGPRPMVPPEHPDHPANAPPEPRSAGPPAHAA